MARSKLAQSMTKIGGKNVTDNDIYESVVSKMDDPGDLGTYRAGLDFRPYGTEMVGNDKLFNGYLDSLVRQYGVIFQRVSLAQNPLSMFKKGIMPVGGKIESIVYDTIEQKIYNPFFRDRKGNRQSPFEQNFTKATARTYEERQDISTPVTIIDSVDTQFFQTLDQLHNYIYGAISSLVNGAVLDEYYLTKLTLSEPIADNKMPAYNINTSDQGQAVKDLARTIKRVSKKMQYFSRDFNGERVNQATLIDNIVVMVQVDRSVDLDTEYFGQLFNPENGKNFNVQYVEVDRFPSIWKYSKDHVVTKDDIDKGYVEGKEDGSYGTFYEGETIKAGTLAKEGATDAVQVLNGDDVAAVILDRDALQVWDMIPTRLSLVANPRGRYQNVFLNKQATLAYIAGLNAMAITMTDKPTGDIKFPTVPDGGSSGGQGSEGSNDSNGSEGSNGSN